MSNNNIRLAIEVSKYMRRLMRELFLGGAGIPIDQVAYLTEDEDTGIIDGLDPSSDEWQWVNAALMLMRTIYGILENAEGEINEEL